MMPSRRENAGFFGGPDPEPSAVAHPDGDDAPLPGAAKEVIACAVALVTLATVVVSARLYCRIVLLRRVGWDDWAMVLALIFSFGNSTGMVLQAITALGRHMDELSPSTVVLFLKEAYFTIISYNACLAFAKISILLLYIRIFGRSHLAVLRMSYIMLAIVAIGSLWSVFSSAFFCLPAESFWDKTIKAKCLSRAPRWFASAGLNIATDFVIIVLPLPVIARMKLPRPQKVGVLAVFTLGLFVCVISILRLTMLIRAVDSKDPSWDNPPCAIWSTIEINVAIICPCIPTLKPLFAGVFSRISGKMRRPHGPTTPNPSRPQLTIGSGGGAWYRGLGFQKTQSIGGTTISTRHSDSNQSNDAHGDLEAGTGLLPDRSPGHKEAQPAMIVLDRPHGNGTDRASR